MPKAQKTERHAYPYDEDEYYPARLVHVEEKAFPYFKKDAQGNRTNEEAVFYKWRWQFAIEADANGGAFIPPRNSYADSRPEYTTHPDDKVRLWAESMLGRELELGEELDTDEMLDGLPCMVRFQHAEPVDSKKNPGEKYYGCNIVEVMPRSGQRQRVAAFAGTDDEPPF